MRDEAVARCGGLARRVAVVADEASVLFVDRADMRALQIDILVYEASYEKIN